MIGVSLALPVLCGKPETAAQQALLSPFGSAGAFLSRLKELGVGSVELRSVSQKTAAQTALATARAVYDAGLRMSIHAALYDAPAQDFFWAMAPLLPMGGGHTVCLTVHTMRGFDSENGPRSAAVLRAWGEYALAQNLPVRFALENNRISEREHDVTTCEEVLAIVEQLSLPNAGVCFDFGHLYSDHLNYPERTPRILPPEGYAGAAVHTHIHAVQGRTHFPLMGQAELPLQTYVSLLSKSGYQGVYNLELEPERYFGIYAPWEALERSVSALKEVLANA